MDKKLGHLIWDKDNAWKVDEQAKKVASQTFLYQQEQKRWAQEQGVREQGVDQNQGNEQNSQIGQDGFDDINANRYRDEVVREKQRFASLNQNIENNDSPTVFDEPSSVKRLTPVELYQQKQPTLFEYANNQQDRVTVSEVQKDALQYDPSVRNVAGLEEFVETIRNYSDSSDYDGGVIVDYDANDDSNVNSSDSNNNSNNNNISNSNSTVNGRGVSTMFDGRRNVVYGQEGNPYNIKAEFTAEGVRIFSDSQDLWRDYHRQIHDAKITRKGRPFPQYTLTLDYEPGHLVLMRKLFAGLLSPVGLPEDIKIFVKNKIDRLFELSPTVSLSQKGTGFLISSPYAALDVLEYWTVTKMFPNMSWRKKTKEWYCRYEFLPDLHAYNLSMHRKVPKLVFNDGVNFPAFTLEDGFDGTLESLLNVPVSVLQTPIPKKALSELERQGKTSVYDILLTLPKELPKSFFLNQYNVTYPDEESRYLQGTVISSEPLKPGSSVTEFTFREKTTSQTFNAYHVQWGRGNFNSAPVNVGAPLVVKAKIGKVPGLGLEPVIEDTMVEEIGQFWGAAPDYYVYRVKSDLYKSLVREILLRLNGVLLQPSFMLENITDGTKVYRDDSSGWDRVQSNGLVETFGAYNNTNVFDGSLDSNVDVSGYSDITDEQYLASYGRSPLDDTSRGGKILKLQYERKKRGAASLAEKTSADSNGNNSKEEHWDNIIDQKILSKKYSNIFDTVWNIHYPQTKAHWDRAKDIMMSLELRRTEIIIQNDRNETSGSPGLKIEEQTGLQEAAKGNFGFPLTKDQQKAIDIINRKFAEGVPSNFLLQADVGAGKTIVAHLSAMQAIDAGYQSVFIAPTEILAKQVYSVFQSLVANSDFDVDVAFLLGSTRAKEKRELLKKIEDGTAQMIIGTHSLLGDDVVYNNLGFVAIDEQQKFGAQQRSKLRHSRKDGKVPHMLMQTATPIPRTIAQTVYGDLDFIELQDKPPGRKPVETEWLRMRPEDTFDRFFVGLWDNVTKEAEKGFQTFVICPLVNESKSDVTDGVVSVEEAYEVLSKSKLAHLNVDRVHGQMKSKEQQEAINKFRDGKTDVLVASTVLEVGVDIPKATRIIVLNAERFGASTLHQIRGRVGRNSLQSKCILVSNALGGKTERRLQSLVDFNDGFKIAEIDLEIRGEGTLFSEHQSGYSDLKFFDGISQLNSRSKVQSAKDFANKVLSDSALKDLALKEARKVYSDKNRLM